MRRIGRRLRAIHGKLERGRRYPPDEALRLLKESAALRFVESVDVAVRLNLDVRKPEQNIRGSVTLPWGTGRDVRVAVFARPSVVEAAREAGAEFVGLEELVDGFSAGGLKVDVVIASEDAVDVVGRVAHILGPRGLMPSHRSGTVTSDVAEAVRKVKGGQVFYRSDRGGVVHSSIGRSSFPVDGLRENLLALLRDLGKRRPVQVKGRYCRGVSLSTTMGIGIPIRLDLLQIS